MAEEYNRMEKISSTGDWINYKESSMNLKRGHWKYFSQRSKKQKKKRIKRGKKFNRMINHYIDKICIYENSRKNKEGTRKSIQRNNGLKLPNPGQAIDIHI